MISKLFPIRACAQIAGILILICSIDGFSQVPVINSFLPVSARAGKSVTINGDHFSAIPANNIVFFGATRAPVLSATATQLIATVPNGATDEFITVTTGGLTAASTLAFIPSGARVIEIDTGTFHYRLSIPAGTQPFFTFINDLDNDGLSEIIVQNTTGFGVLKNTSHDSVMRFSDGALFGDRALTITPCDIDNDGKPDIVSTGIVMDNNIYYFRNSGSIPSLANTQTPSPVDHALGYNLAAGDLDGDGKTDLAGSRYNSKYVVIYKNGGTNFTGANMFLLNSDLNPGDVAFGDMDGDGLVDILTTNFDTTAISVFRNSTSSGILHFDDAISIQVVYQPIQLYPADIDGDGLSDIMIHSYNGIYVVRNNSTPGNLSFEPAVMLFSGFLETFGAAGDINGDGKPDIAVINYSDSSLYVFKNKATAGALSSASFAPPVVYPIGSTSQCLAIGDLNNDGAVDIAVSNYKTGTVTVFINGRFKKGEAVVVPPVDPPVDELVVYNGVSPNGDGKNDIWYIKNIELRSDTKLNHVTVYNRWGDVVFTADNYDNANGVFHGLSNDGVSLPLGIYFYKIEFESKHPLLTGFLSIRR